MFSVWYFLTAAGLVVLPSDSVLIAVIMMIVGAFVIWYCNRNYTSPTCNKDILNGQADDVKDFHLTSRDIDVKSFDGEYVDGYCHLPRKFKTCRLNRIEGDIIIRETGEAIDPYE